MYNYADDNTLSFSDSSLSIVKQQMEKAADIAVTWFNNNYMQANAAKFHVALFTSVKLLSPSMYKAKNLKVKIVKSC